MPKGLLAWLIALSGVWIVFTGSFTDGHCPLQFHPPRVVVKYGDSASVNCNTSCTNNEGMGLEAAYGGTELTADVSSVTWTVENLTYWTIEPKCYLNDDLGNQITEALSVILYKPPNSVSIRRGSDGGPMAEGQEYTLICDIKDVAPVRYLTVRWYKGKDIVKSESVHDLIKTVKTPKDLSPDLNITPSRDDNGGQYTCEAELDLGPEGPPLPPTVTSEPYHISVYYPTTFLNPDTEIVELEEGDTFTLNCSATGNPTPEYSWQSSLPQEKMENLPQFTSTFLLPGTYNCTASNSQGSKTKHFIVNVNVKGSHSGITAGIVVAALALFAFVSVCVVYHKQRISPVAGTQAYEVS